MKYNKKTLEKAQQLLKEAGYVVRYEKGNFNSGYCVLEEKKVVVINKYFETEAKVSSLLEIIKDLKIENSDLSSGSIQMLEEISQLKLDTFQ